MKDVRKQLILNSYKICPTSVRVTIQVGVLSIVSHKWRKEISTTPNSLNMSLISKWHHRTDKRKMIVCMSDLPKVRPEQRQEQVKAIIIGSTVPAEISHHKFLHNRKIAWLFIFKSRKAYLTILSLWEGWRSRLKLILLLRCDVIHNSTTTLTS